MAISSVENGVARRGLMVVISSPSGAGKSTIARLLLEDKKMNLSLSISVTTRQRRPSSDTSTMYNIMGIDNWTAHAVWVILSDGKVYMASTHSHGHEVDNNSGNNLEGHICIHFPREMTAEEKESMPYAVSHQND